MYDPTSFDPLDANNDFIKNYREALKQLYDDSVANLNNQRLLDHTSIMSNANTRGMMYSNFPERSKIQYDTNTYMPNLVKARQSYQTGLDDMRNNALNAVNAIRYYQELIDKNNSDGDGDTTPQKTINDGVFSNAMDLVKEAAQKLKERNSL